MNNDWISTLAAVRDLSTQAERAGLLTGAIRSGVLEQCREPLTVTDLAQRVGGRDDIVSAIAGALVAAGVLTDLGDPGVVISDLYAPLLRDGVDRRALDRLTAASVRAGLLDGLDVSSPSSYWSIDSSQRVALATSATADPETAFGRERIVAGVQAISEWDAAFRRGGRFLELGCGVAGAIVSCLATYPDLTAVGIDIADDVLEVARARASAVGVTDRVTFLVVDAADFRDPEPFDVVFWPQSFYPDTARAGALATAYANLRPGGLLVTALNAPAAGETPAGAVEVLLRTMWDIHPASADEIRHEQEAAGFIDVHAHPATPPALPLMTSRRSV